MKVMCPYCEQCLPDNFQEKRRQKKANSQRWAMQRRKEKGLPVGRKRSADYEEIVALRSKGKTYREICQTLKVSLGTVHRAISKDC